VAYAKNPPQPNARSGAVYGGGAITDRGVMRQMLFAWLDETYEL
jgi:hypothetical protein